jgi:hypothetical protein
MSWASLTISRNDIDSYEGATFNSYNANTELGIAANDALVLAAAKSELEDDIIRTMDNEQYTEAELLDAVIVADDRGLIVRMLTYKFLMNWFNQDSSKVDSLSYVKAREYAGKYYRTLNGGLSGISSKLSKPRQVPRFSMVR